jgi:hypothetical protein
MCKISIQTEKLKARQRMKNLIPPISPPTCRWVGKKIDIPNTPQQPKQARDREGVLSAEQSEVPIYRDTAGFQPACFSLTIKQ